MLTLNRSNEQLSSHHVSLPASWPKPKFSYNQSVTWHESKYAEGVIIGLEYHDGSTQIDQGWFYSIIIDQDCPYLANLICANPEIESIHESDLILVN